MRNVLPILFVLALASGAVGAEQAFAQSASVSLDPNFGALLNNTALLATGIIAVSIIGGVIALLVIARGQLFGNEKSG